MTKPLAEREIKLAQELLRSIVENDAQEFYIAVKDKSGTEFSFSSEGGVKLSNRINRRMR